MPWQQGFVPSDGFRYYIHGTHYEMIFDCCGLRLEDFYAENVEHTNSSAYYLMHKFYKSKRKKCPACDRKNPPVRYSIEVERSEMAESKFKAYRIMGWV